MKKILATSLVMAFVLTGCNTFKGVGKDVSKAGQAVTTTAEKTSAASAANPCMNVFNYYIRILLFFQQVIDYCPFMPVPVIF